MIDDVGDRSQITYAIKVTTEMSAQRGSQSNQVEEA